jgi:class 3 adenylate cyclase
MAAVLFADLVGFSKKSVPAQLAAKEALTGLLQRLVTPYPSAGRVVLDTGDGAAVGFLVSPEYALGLALRLRRELVAAPAGSLLQSQDLRLGINLGPLKVVTDVNGHPNLVGEGINSAERIMSFAEPGDTTASRSFQEAVYYLDASFQSLFEPLGMRADKHGREHEVFRLTTSGPAIDAALESLGVGAGPGDSRGAGGRAAAIAASSTRSLGGLAALGGPARIGLVAAVLLVVVGTGAWVAWPARQVARETAAPSSAAPREAAVPVTTPSPASSETTPSAAAPPAVAAPVPAASAGASASGASGAPGASGESEQASRAVQGSPASLRAPAPAAPTAPPEAPAVKRAKAPAAPPKSAMAGPAPATPQVSPRAPEAAPATDSLRASPRCSRLLQRAAVGETLTPDEQRELASSCR